MSRNSYPPAPEGLHRRRSSLLKHPLIAISKLSSTKEPFEVWRLSNSVKPSHSRSRVASFWPAGRQGRHQIYRHRILPLLGLDHLLHHSHRRSGFGIWQAAQEAQMQEKLHLRPLARRYHVRKERRVNSTQNIARLM